MVKISRKNVITVLPVPMILIIDVADTIVKIREDYGRYTGEGMRRDDPNPSTRPSEIFHAD